MKEAPKSKGLALLLLGGKGAKPSKPEQDESEAPESGPSEARGAAAQGILDAIKDSDAAALDEALSAFLEAHKADLAKD